MVMLDHHGSVPIFSHGEGDVGTECGISSVFLEAVGLVGCTHGCFLFELMLDFEKLVN
jgi:hypothetical protein